MPALAEHDRRGSGEPLLLIHGFTATHRMWGPVGERLTEHFDVLNPTLPGHTGGPPLAPGSSMLDVADALEAMMDEVGWRDAHVAGFSLGGWLGLELARRGRVRTFTGVAPAGATACHTGKEAKRISRSFRRQRASAKASLGQLERIAARPALRKVAMGEQMVRGDRMSPAELVRAVRDFVATPAFDTIGEATETAGGITGLTDVKVPVHLVWGVQDRVLPVKHAAWFQEEIPHSSLRLLHPAGHVPFWDQTDLVVRELRRGAAG